MPVRIRRPVKSQRGERLVGMPQRSRHVRIIRRKADERFAKIQPFLRVGEGIRLFDQIPRHGSPSNCVGGGGDDIIQIVGATLPIVNPCLRHGKLVVHDARHVQSLADDV